MHGLCPLLICFLVVGCSMANEDFTTGAIVDLNNRFTIAPNLIQIAAMTENEDAYLYWDYGVGYFEGDFSHQIKYEDMGGEGSLAVWALSNVLDDAGDWASNDDEAIWVWINHSLGTVITQSGSNNGLAKTAFTLTEYYLTIARAGSTLTVSVYTTAARDVLAPVTGVGTNPLIVTVVPTESYQYVLPVISRNIGGVGTVTGEISTLDLGESPAHRRGRAPFKTSLGLRGEHLSLNKPF